MPIDLGLVPVVLAPARVPSFQIIAHRIIWSTVLVVAWLLISSRLGWWKKIAAQPRALPILAVSSLTIAFNWGLFIWAVNAGHVIETSLGYFNPLVNVLLGVLVLTARLRRLQWVAVAMAAVGVAWLTIDAGTPPWIALGLACSFGLYGLLRKLVSVDPVAGLGVESLYLFLHRHWRFSRSGPKTVYGGALLHGWGWRNDLLLIFGGAVTAGTAGDRRLRREAHPAVAGRHPAVHRAEPAAAAGRVLLPRRVDTGKAIGCRDPGRPGAVCRRQHPHDAHCEAIAPGQTRRTRCSKERSPGQQTTHPPQGERWR